MMVPFSRRKNKQQLRDYNDGDKCNASADSSCSTDDKTTIKPSLKSLNVRLRRLPSDDSSGSDLTRRRKRKMARILFTDSGSDREYDGDLEGCTTNEAKDVDLCPVCLNAFSGQDTGIPNGCYHRFCLECIEEWAKNVSTCPVDRKEFSAIVGFDGVTGKQCKKVQVKNKNEELYCADWNLDELADLIVCETCGAPDREDSLLLCDACNLGYHIECLQPALTSVPLGAWFCPACTMLGVSVHLPVTEGSGNSAAALHRYSSDDNSAETIIYDWQYMPQALGKMPDSHVRRRRCARRRRRCLRQFNQTRGHNERQQVKRNISRTMCNNYDLFASSSDCCAEEIYHSVEAKDYNRDSDYTPSQSTVTATSLSESENESVFGTGYKTRQKSKLELQKQCTLLKSCRVVLKETDDKSMRNCQFFQDFSEKVNGGFKRSHNCSLSEPTETRRSFDDTSYNRRPLVQRHKFNANLVTSPCKYLSASQMMSISDSNNKFLKPCKVVVNGNIDYRNSFVQRVDSEKPGKLFKMCDKNEIHFSYAAKRRSRRLRYLMTDNFPAIFEPNLRNSTRRLLSEQMQRTNSRVLSNSKEVSLKGKRRRLQLSQNAILQKNHRQAHSFTNKLKLATYCGVSSFDYPVKFPKVLLNDIMKTARSHDIKNWFTKDWRHSEFKITPCSVQQVYMFGMQGESSGDSCDEGPPLFPTNDHCSSDSEVNPLQDLDVENSDGEAEKIEEPEKGSEESPVESPHVDRPCLDSDDSNNSKIEDNHSEIDARSIHIACDSEEMQLKQGNSNVSSHCNHSDSEENSLHQSSVVSSHKFSGASSPENANVNSPLLSSKNSSPRTNRNDSALSNRVLSPELTDGSLHEQASKHSSLEPSETNVTLQNSNSSCSAVDNKVLAECYSNSAADSPDDSPLVVSSSSSKHCVVPSSTRSIKPGCDIISPTRCHTNLGEEQPQLENSDSDTIVEDADIEKSASDIEDHASEAEDDEQGTCKSKQNCTQVKEEDACIRTNLAAVKREQADVQDHSLADSDVKLSADNDEFFTRSPNSANCLHRVEDLHASKSADRITIEENESDLMLTNNSNKVGELCISNKPSDNAGEVSKKHARNNEKAKKEKSTKKQEQHLLCTPANINSLKHSSGGVDGDNVAPFESDEEAVKVDVGPQPKISISDLPRIPKKKQTEVVSAPVVTAPESHKRSVLDYGEKMDIHAYQEQQSWKEYKRHAIIRREKSDYPRDRKLVNVGMKRKMAEDDAAVVGKTDKVLENSKKPSQNLNTFAKVDSAQSSRQMATHEKDLSKVDQQLEEPVFDVGKKHHGEESAYRKQAKVKEEKNASRVNDPPWLQNYDAKIDLPFPKSSSKSTNDSTLLRRYTGEKRDKCAKTHRPNDRLDKHRHSHRNESKHSKSKTRCHNSPHSGLRSKSVHWTSGGNESPIPSPPSVSPPSPPMELSPFNDSPVHKLDTRDSLKKRDHEDTSDWLTVFGESRTKKEAKSKKGKVEKKSQTLKPLAQLPNPGTFSSSAPNSCLPQPSDKNWPSYPPAMPMFPTNIPPPPIGTPLPFPPPLAVNRPPANLPAHDSATVVPDSKKENGNDAYDVVDMEIELSPHSPEEKLSLPRPQQKRRTVAFVSSVPVSSKQKPAINRQQQQEKAVDAVKYALKPYYRSGELNKDQYKDIMRKCVPKICHNIHQDIDGNRVKILVHGYVSKIRQEKVVQVKRPVPQSRHQSHTSAKTGHRR